MSFSDLSLLHIPLLSLQYPCQSFIFHNAYSFRRQRPCWLSTCCTQAPKDQSRRGRRKSPFKGVLSLSDFHPRVHQRLQRPDPMSRPPPTPSTMMPPRLLPPSVHPWTLISLTYHVNPTMTNAACSVSGLTMLHVLFNLLARAPSHPTTQPMLF